jgi:hypothetical protein
VFDSGSTFKTSAPSAVPTRVKPRVYVFPSLATIDVGATL